MTIHIFDSSLVDTGGHHFEYNKSLYEEMRARGLPAVVYCHKKAISEVAGSLNAVPFFSRTIHDSFFKIRKIRALLDFFPSNLFFFFELRKLQSNQLQNEDLVLFHTITQHQLLGIYLWYYLLPEKRRPFLFLFLRYTNAGTWPTGLFYGAVFRLFSIFGGKRIFFLTDSDILAEEYQSLSGKKLQVFPIPHMPDVNIFKRSEKPKEINIVFLGFPLEDRGYHLLPETIEITLKRRSGVKFTLQAKNIQHPSKSIREAIDRLASMPGNVKIIDGNLESKQYYELMAKADAILITHNPKAYHGRTSGIFAEALAFGKPTIVCRGTWMAEQAARYPSVIVFDEFSSASIAKAIEKYVDNKNEYDRLAAADSIKWRKFHNAKNYVEMLLQLTASAELK